MGLEVVNVLDEPSAANLVLKIQDGAIVDVGGGTTGIAVIKTAKLFTPMMNLQVGFIYHW